jgi:hypothetical protein
MKMKILKIIIILVSISAEMFSQTAVITDDATYNSGHSSSVLDIKSTTKGVLIPRLTVTERNLISSPATGLLIYQTDSTPGFYYYNGSGWALVGPSVDGSETKVSAGTNVSVTGAGTSGSPYVVNAATADGSETKIDAGTNITVTGSGTSASHYIINYPSPSGSETKVDAGTNVTVTGSGTSASHYVVNASAGDGSETKVDAGTNVTVTGSGTVVSPYVINATGGNGAETKVTATTPVSKSGTGTTGDPYIISFITQSVTQVQRDALTPVQFQYVWCSNCGTSGEFQVYNGSTWTNATGGTRTLVIGETFQGGKVGYVLQSGDPGYVAGESHGFIVTASDVTTSIAWGCNNVSLTGADGTAIGTGNQNTTDIITGCGGSNAAKSCYDLVQNGYSDWYLPSKDELNKLYLNNGSIGMWTSTNYWSSSEVSSTTAYAQIFSTGLQSAQGKTNTYRVRAIRSF